MSLNIEFEFLNFTFDFYRNWKYKIRHPKIWFYWKRSRNYSTFKAGLTLNNLYDTTCMIQLVWMCQIASSYKPDVQIFVWYNFWKIGWVLFLPTCMKEINQSHFKFCNAELFWRKIKFNEMSLNQVICFFIRSFCWKEKNKWGY